MLDMDGVAAFEATFGDVLPDPPTDVRPICGTPVYDDTLKDAIVFGAKLGEGAFGFVSRAVIARTDAVVAVKTVRKDFLFTKEEMNAVVREFEIHSSLHHPNIVRAWFAVETKKCVHIVMQFVPGQTLEWHMRLSGPMREADAQDVFSKVLAAVAYLHTRSIIHCDIKPSNFLLRQRAAAAAAGAGGGAAAAGGAAKSAPPVASSSLVVTAARFDVLLCDFGNARHSRDAKYYKQTGDVSLVPCAEVTGTCGYIAPEILERHSYDASVDMWSCGVLLYKMLSGSLPMSNTAEDVLFQGRAWKDVTPHAMDLIKRLLQTKSGLRATAAGALAHTWFRVGISATPPS